MAEEISFTQLDPFKLTGVIVTSKALGHGSYATVLELEYMGLKCAGKKIHDVLLRQGALSYPVKRFERECQLLSQIRHPNIVQFLGLCVQSNEEVPILVMEFLPTNLTSCIEKHGVMPQQISYSILHDVALGLCYLHSQTPPIIHRDLSSNNVLLTREMTAKISDLGVARILNLTPLQVSHMTQTPGTPAFMPPEVMVANPKYDTNIDEFSYGILMIHVLSGRWPEPQVGPTQSENGKLIPVSEAKRRDMFLQIIGRDHPLMSLIMKCIDNDQGQRSHANMIVNKMKKMVAQFPTILQNQLQMQKLIEVSEEDKRALTEVAQMRAEIIKQKEEEIENLTNHLQKKLESQNSEKERTKLAHSIEVEALQVQLQHLKSDLRASNAEKAVVYTENITMENKLSEQLKKLITLQADNETLRSANRRLEEQAALREARMRRFNEEIMIKKELILSREATIATVSEQLSKAREYLVTKKQVYCVSEYNTHYTSKQAHKSSERNRDGSVQEFSWFKFLTWALARPHQLLFP